jgi:hypothetical protein
VVRNPEWARDGLELGELIAHIAYNRNLRTGTIPGSGTVSNKGCRQVGSACLAEQRAVETIDHGEARTPFLKFGDTLRFEVLDETGASVFGAIEHRMVPSKTWSLPPRLIWGPDLFCPRVPWFRRAGHKLVSNCKRIDEIQHTRGSSFLVHCEPCSISLSRLPLAAHRARVNSTALLRHQPPIVEALRPTKRGNASRRHACAAQLPDAFVQT